MIDRVIANPKLEIIWNSEVIEILGNEKHVTGVRLQMVNTNTHQPDNSILDVRGLFVAIGHTPNTKFVSGLLDVDTVGYIKTARNLATSQIGIWAAGDCQDPFYRQAITAAGSGCQAALEIERYLS